MLGHIIRCQNFHSGGKKLRAFFEQSFANPREGETKRFVWDYWHVADQYTLIRTPAANYFPQKIFEPFLQQLLVWGEDNLGCRSISPPWLSYYVDGCAQEIHADFPHGPWAFVYSLTPWKGRKFSGGETLIANENMLSYWENLQSRNFHEKGELFLKIPPLMGQLLVFNPRLPHGVERVVGVRDPLEARVAIHGWFTNPRPYVDGNVSPQKVASAIATAEEQIYGAATKLRMSGYWGLRLTIGGNGKANKITELACTLVAPGLEEPQLRKWKSMHLGLLKIVQFPKARTSYKLTLPINL